MKKHTPRKHIDPMAWITKRAPLREDQQRDLGIAYHASLQALLSGHGTEQAWATLACTLNVSLILCECGIGAGSIEAIKLARAALCRSRERAQRTGKWAFDGDGIRVILAAINLHDEQISRTTRGQISDALREVNRRVEMDEVMA